MQHSRTKHIAIKFHFLRDNIEKGNIELLRVNTEHQLIDIFTKPLDSSRFTFLQGELGVIHHMRLFQGGVLVSLSLS